jgi:hypothetical protein
MNDVTCLYTTVVNVSGSAMHFPFLPEHGITLADGEEFTFIGHPVEACIRHQRVTSGRNFAGLEYALENELLEIIKTPNPILYDDGADVTKMLALYNGALFAVDPCWAGTSYSSPL